MCTLISVVKCSIFSVFVHSINALYLLKVSKAPFIALKTIYLVVSYFRT